MERTGFSPLAEQVLQSLRRRAWRCQWLYYAWCRKRPCGDGVDGISAVESYMPRFYYIKGFYNGNRNSTEIENLSSVEFNKGANSLTQGSGALGGSDVDTNKKMYMIL